MELAGCLPKMLRTVSCDARVYRGLRLPQYDCRLRRRKRYVQQIRYNAVQVCGAGVTDMVAEGRSSPRMNVVEPAPHHVSSSMRGLQHWYPATSRTATQPVRTRIGTPQPPESVCRKPKDSGPVAETT